ncbi:ABC transporter permease [Alkalihalobacillus sp. R86527]|uniref:ABC transporter permease n=1 Tax=Alkalihalobacillus sp. R86527 TaxID=3093863 RepID=UPI00366C4BC5
MATKKRTQKLVKTGFLELIREPKTSFFIFIFPLFFLAMFGIMGQVIPKSQSGLSFVEFMFPGILIFALLSTGLFGTSVPLIEMRKKGTLRLLQVTPLSKSTFLISQIAVRFIISILQIIIFLLIGLAMNMFEVQLLPVLFAVSLLGMAMILSLGFIFGGILKSVELAGGLLGGFSAPLLIFSGVLLPLTIMPEAFEKVAMFIPFTYLGDLIRSIMFENGSPLYSTPTNLMAICGCTILFFFIAKLTFKWESV